MPMETVFQRLMLLNPEGSGEFLMYQSKNRTWSYSSVCHNVNGFFFFFFLKEANSNGWARRGFKGRDE